MGSSGGPIPNDLGIDISFLCIRISESWNVFNTLCDIVLYSAGVTSLRNRNAFVGDSSGKSEANLGVSGRQGFKISEIGGDRMSGSGSVQAGFKGFGSDAGSSGIPLSLCFWGIQLISKIHYFIW